MQMTATHPSTSLQAFFCWSTIFTKTSKGREEISQRRAGLTARQRGVLIMLDGIKRLDKLMSPLPKEELDTIVDFLAKQELIEIAQAPSSISPALPAKESAIIVHNTIAPGNASESMVITTEETHATQAKLPFLTDEKKLREVKDFMITTAHTYLGLLSADLIAKIERAKDAPQLMAILGLWFMALRDSKHGKRFASVYMEQTLVTLRGGNSTIS